MPSLAIKAWWLSGEWVETIHPRVGCGREFDATDRVRAVLEASDRLCAVLDPTDRLCDSTPTVGIRTTTAMPASMRWLDAVAPQGRTTAVGTPTGRTGLLVAVSASRSRAVGLPNGRVCAGQAEYAARR